MFRKFFGKPEEVKPPVDLSKERNLQKHGDAVSLAKRIGKGRGNHSYMIGANISDQGEEVNIWGKGRIRVVKPIK